MSKGRIYDQLDRVLGVCMLPPPLHLRHPDMALTTAPVPACHVYSLLLNLGEHTEWLGQKKV